VRVLKDFEQIQGAVEEICLYGPGDGLIGKLLNMMPDLEKMLQPWATVWKVYKADIKALAAKKTPTDKGQPFPQLHATLLNMETP
jgi:DNA mismatch repair protein MSH6